MNFYQRANLTMSLAVVLGIELAFSNWATTNTIDWQELITYFPWILFQFLFRIKVLLDDHNFFGRSNFLESNGRFHHFLMMMISTLLYALAATLSFKGGVSFWFFLTALVISTIWVLMDFKGLYDSGNLPSIWLGYNFLYCLFLGLALYCNRPLVTCVCSIIALFFLYLDFRESKTVGSAPNG